MSAAGTVDGPANAHSIVHVLSMLTSGGGILAEIWPPLLKSGSGAVPTGTDVCSPNLTVPVTVPVIPPTIPDAATVAPSASSRGRYSSGVGVYLVTPLKIAEWGLPPGWSRRCMMPDAEMVTTGLVSDSSHDGAYESA